MTWNYRILEFPATENSEGYRALHEVHYDEETRPVSYSSEPASFSEALDQDGDIKGGLEMALEAVSKYPVLPVTIFGIPLKDRPTTPRSSELR